MNIDGVIPCSVQKWVSLVDKLSPSQKFRFYETDMQGMFRIPSIKMRDFCFTFYSKVTIRVAKNSWFKRVLEVLLEIKVLFH